MSGRFPPLRFARNQVAADKTNAERDTRLFEQVGYLAPQTDNFEILFKQ